MIGFQITTSGSVGTKQISQTVRMFSEGPNELELIAELTQLVDDLLDTQLLAHIPAAVESALETLAAVEIDRVSQRLGLHVNGVDVTISTDMAVNESFTVLGPYTIKTKEDLQGLLGILGGRGHGNNILATVVNQLNQAIPFGASDHQASNALEMRIDT